jgi:hypothetical protein
MWYTLFCMSTSNVSTHDNVQWKHRTPPTYDPGAAQKFPNEQDDNGDHFSVPNKAYIDQ